MSEGGLFVVGTNYETWPNGQVEEWFDRYRYDVFDRVDHYMVLTTRRGVLSRGELCVVIESKAVTLKLPQQKLRSRRSQFYCDGGFNNDYSGKVKYAERDEYEETWLPETTLQGFCFVVYSRGIGWVSSSVLSRV